MSTIACVYEFLISGNVIIWYQLPIIWIWSSSLKLQLHNLSPCYRTIHLKVLRTTTSIWPIKKLIKFKTELTIFLAPTCFTSSGITIYPKSPGKKSRSSLNFVSSLTGHIHSTTQSYQFYCLLMSYVLIHQILSFFIILLYLGHYYFFTWITTKIFLIAMLAHFQSILHTVQYTLHSKAGRSF